MYLASSNEIMLGSFEFDCYFPEVTEPTSSGAVSKHMNYKISKFKTLKVKMIEYKVFIGLTINLLLNRHLGLC